jgi:hypothetical protein
MNIETPLVQKKVFNNMAQYKFFAFTCFILFPFWLTLLLPITLLYLLFNTLFKKTKTVPYIEEAKLKNCKLNPISTSKNKREFDVIIFGATGFTGSYLCEYLANNYNLHISNIPEKNNKKNVSFIFYINK